jgi:hypothetical protein
MSDEKTECCDTKKTCCCTATGTVKNGKLQDAIDAAKENAIKSTGIPDVGIHWRLEMVTGHAGTVAGLHEITALISFHQD